MSDKLPLQGGGAFAAFGRHEASRRARGPSTSALALCRPFGSGPPPSRGLFVYLLFPLVAGARAAATSASVLPGFPVRRLACCEFARSSRQLLSCLSSTELSDVTCSERVLVWLRRNNGENAPRLDAGLTDPYLDGGRFSFLLLFFFEASSACNETPELPEAAGNFSSPV